MTEQIQILKRLLECVSKDLKVLWIAQKLLSMYLGENRRWVPVNNLTGLYPTVSSSKTNISVPKTLSYNIQTKYFLTYELYFIAGCC